MYYSTVSVATQSITCLLPPLALFNTIFAIHSFRVHLRSSSYQVKSGTGINAKLPTLLRLTFLLCNTTALLCCIAGMILPFYYVSEATNVSAFAHDAMSQFQALDHDSTMCVIMSKVGSATYAVAKLWSYLFFFIKQRTVRPLSAVSKMEKLVLLLTLGVLPFATIIAIVGQGDMNQIDGTCQLFMPIYILICMAIADATLSFLYLYLFIEPLRETILTNRLARSNAAGLNNQPQQVQLTVTEAQSPPSTTKSLLSSTAAASAAPPALNTALESLMRKNTWACVVTVTTSCCSMGFMLIAHITDNQTLRKIVSFVGCFDIIVTTFAISHIMWKSGSNNDKTTPGSPNEVRKMTLAESDTVKSSPVPQHVAVSPKTGPKNSGSPQTAAEETNPTAAGGELTVVQRTEDGRPQTTTTTAMERGTMSPTAAGATDEASQEEVPDTLPGIASDS